MPSYLVTGAARGLGYGFLKVLAADPNNVVLGLVRNTSAAKALLAADGIPDANVHLLQADITDVNGLKVAAAEASEILGDAGLDVLINNAAYINQTAVLRTLADDEDNIQLAADELHKSFDTNVVGVLKTVIAFLPLIRKSQLKKVVTISSAMGDLDFINQTHIGYDAPYAISKAAVNALVAKLAATYEGEGILFISLCPGMVMTTAAENAAKYEDPDLLTRMQDIYSKMSAYSSSLQPPSAPEDAARKVLDAIERSSLESGSSGSFLSHNGTKKFL
ncbi:Short chain dehydrogenase virK [Exophiala dermatitidis]